MCADRAKTGGQTRTKPSHPANPAAVQPPRVPLSSDKRSLRCIAATHIFHQRKKRSENQASHHERRANKSIRFLRISSQYISRNLLIACNLTGQFPREKKNWLQIISSNYDERRYGRDRGRPHACAPVYAKCWACKCCARELYIFLRCIRVFYFCVVHLCCHVTCNCIVMCCTW